MVIGSYMMKRKRESGRERTGLFAPMKPTLLHIDSLPNAIGMTWPRYRFHASTCQHWPPVQADDAALQQQIAENERMKAMASAVFHWLSPCTYLCHSWASRALSGSIIFSLLTKKEPLKQLVITIGTDWLKISDLWLIMVQHWLYTIIGHQPVVIEVVYIYIYIFVIIFRYIYIHIFTEREGHLLTRNIRSGYGVIRDTRIVAIP